MSFQNIPDEMRAFNQWIVWRLEDHGGEKPTKIPYNPRTGKMASVSDPSAWASFDECVKLLTDCPDWYSGLGFVLTENDPYTFIDLDDTSKVKSPDTPQAALDRQLKIFHQFDSYSETSPSGNGLHIIVRGKVPAGRRRSAIEIYSTLRYMTMTGNIFNGKAVINDRQELVTALWEEMGGGAAVAIYTGDDIQKDSDEVIVQRAMNAANGDKFAILHGGQWQELYSSQSEADFAYMDMLAFYTQSRVQLKRMFRSSMLGKRDKAQREDYVERMVLRSFDRLLPPIDFDGLNNQLELRLSEKRMADASAGQVQGGNAQEGQRITEATAQPFLPYMAPQVKTPPPGLLGEIATYIYAASARQVPEIALCAAIGLMAGICGRGYNVSGSGLNQYILLLANTGVGKEGMAGGIDKLMQAIKLPVPASSSFVGPAQIASGQALLKHLSKTSQCFVSILGEFGSKLKQLSSDFANPAQQMLLGVLRDLYHKSDAGAVLRPSIYSQQENNTDTVMSPAFSILAETNPDEFYRSIDETMISGGLLPRFTIIEYSGPVVALNEHRMLTPPMPLVERLAQLAAQAHTLMHQQKVLPVELTEEAQLMSRALGTFCDKQINDANAEVVRHLWNRVHLKTLRLAALLAVGNDMYHPKIDPATFEWAKSIVTNSTWALLRRFERGEIGKDSEESKQNAEIMRVIKEYVQGDQAHAEKYGAPVAMWHGRVVPYAYIQRRLVASACFRQDRAGATNAIKRSLQMLLESDVLREVGKADLSTRFGTTMRGFVISNPAQILSA